MLGVNIAPMKKLEPATVRFIVTVHLNGRELGELVRTLDLFKKVKFLSEEEANVWLSQIVDWQRFLTKE